MLTDGERRQESALQSVHGALPCESLYEAVALAVADFRDDALLRDRPGAMTDFTVAVLRNPTEHKIRLNQVTKWAEPAMREGPAGIAKRQRVQTLLGQPG